MCLTANDDGVWLVIKVEPVFPTRIIYTDTEFLNVNINKILLAWDIERIVWVDISRLSAFMLKVFTAF